MLRDAIEGMRMHKVDSKSSGKMGSKVSLTFNAIRCEFCVWIHYFLPLSRCSRRTSGYDDDDVTRYKLCCFTCRMADSEKKLNLP